MSDNYIKLYELPKNRIGTVIKDYNGVKIQLVKKNKWVIYKHSHTHKNKHNLKTAGK